MRWLPLVPEAFLARFPVSNLSRGSAARRGVVSLRPPGRSRRDGEINLWYPGYAMAGETTNMFACTKRKQQNKCMFDTFCEGHLLIY